MSAQDATGTRFVTTPCHRCGRSVFVAWAAGQRVVLDPGTKVYSRESDGDGGVSWLPIPDGVIVAQHECRGSKA